MGRLKIREYQTEDKHEIVKLLKKGLSERFTLERWNWLHHNKVTMGSDIIVAEYDGKIVGNVGAIKKKFCYNDEIFVGGRHIDPVVDVIMRGKGVFFKMLGALNELSSDVNFSYTFPNNPSFRGFSKFGYKSIGPIHIQYCQLSFMKSNFREKFRYFKTGVKIALKDCNTVRKVDIGELERLKPILPIDRYYLVRNFDYIRWRYVESPVKMYDMLAFEKDGMITVSCVVEEEESNVSILDLIPYTKNVDASMILSGIKKIYGNVKINNWSTGLQNINKYFYGKGIQNFMILEGNRKMPNNLYDKNYWYVTKGEVEGN